MTDLSLDFVISKKNQSHKKKLARPCGRASFFVRKYVGATKDSYPEFGNVFGKSITSLAVFYMKEGTGCECTATYSLDY